MSDIPSFPYRILWEERSVRSVATCPLSDANEALDRLRSGRVRGAIVLLAADPSAPV
jgi:propanol-preferring alcohol dehydrogenase